MGNPDRPIPRQSIAESMQGTEGLLRHAGKDFLVDFYTAIRSLKLYPLANDQAQRAVTELTATAEAIMQIESDLEIKNTGNFLFINGTRIRHDLDSVALFNSIIEAFKSHGIGAINVDEAVTRDEWIALLSVLSKDLKVDKDEALELVSQGMTAAGVSHIEVVKPDEDQGGGGEEEAKEIAKRTYEKGVAASKDLVGSVRMGKSASVKKVKRAVQGIVDQVLGNETSLMGLTTIRDYDEYTFTHSVNVCTFAVSIGKRLGLSKLQLHDLGMAALLHDIGKSHIPLEILNKKGGLDEDEWRMMQSHPWLGVLALFSLRGYGTIPYRSVIAAYEHHMKTDLTGYPKSLRPRELSLFSKIIAVADSFDAATSRRSYQTTPLQPDQVLMEMWKNPKRGLDRVLVKGMINLLGVYPVGTCVAMNTGEFGVVHSANPNPRRIDRPLVRIIRDVNGEEPEVPLVVDLAEVSQAGSYARSIVRVLDPAEIDVNPGAYFV